MEGHRGLKMAIYGQNYGQILAKFLAIILVTPTTLPMTMEEFANAYLQDLHRHPSMTQCMQFLPYMAIYGPYMAIYGHIWTIYRTIRFVLFRASHCDRRIEPNASVSACSPQPKAPTFQL